MAPPGPAVAFAAAVTDLPTIEAAGIALRRREVSAAELADAASAALTAIHPTLHVLAEGEPRRARAMASEAQAALDAGDERPLLGIPMAHKDMFYRAGRESACGSRVLEGHVPDVTATALTRLDAAGAVDCGRLNMVELAFGVTGHNAIVGTPRNPWDPARITGGSSSGSAAAVAAGAVFAALGSDTGGSIRVPASCCGLVGTKPTYGRVSRFGAMPLSASLDHVGPLCRSVRDAALVLQALAGQDPDDPLSAAEPVPYFMRDLERGCIGITLGIPSADDLKAVSEPVLAAFDGAVQTYQRLGATLRRVPLRSIADANTAATLVIAAEAAAVHANAIQERPSDFSEPTLARLRTGAFVPATRYLQALSLRARVLDDLLVDGLAEVDALLLPTIDDPVPTIADTELAAGPDYLRLVGRLARWCRPFNVTGLPALAMPIAFDHVGVPVGAQLVGRPFDEAGLFRVARAFERETGLTGRRPPVSAALPC